MVGQPLRMTEAEYLAYDASHDGKYELVNGEVVAMAGATEAHSIVQLNLGSALLSRLRGSGCRPFGPDMRVKISETGLYAYPDVVVVCGKPDFAPTTPETLLNPKLIAEVLSDSTRGYDVGAKASHYRQRPTLDALVFVDSLEKRVQLQTRNANGTWTLAEMTDGSLPLTCVNVEIPLPDIYEGWQAAPQR